jgi:membrane fusion protein, multidrug efflux system
MKLHRNISALALAFAIAVAALLVGFLVGRSGRAGQAEHAEEAENAPVAKVKVAAVEEGKLEELVRAFGQVIAPPEDVQTISVPFECRVRRVRVVAGEAVTPQMKIIDIEPSPESLLTLSDARTTYQAAERELVQVEQKMELKLATQSELSIAQQAMQLAQSKLESLEKRNMKPRQLAADLAGLVSKVDAQEGQIVPAGGLLVELVAAERIQVRLGVEPAQAPRIKKGQHVHLSWGQASNVPVVDGTVSMVTQRVNPASRLVDVYVALPPRSPLMLETFIKAGVVVQTRQALRVPRQAVLMRRDKHVLFLVEDGKAVQREVQAGLEDERNVELLSDVVKAGEEVVVEGNAELEDGAAVQVGEKEQGTSEPAASAPTETAPDDPAPAAQDEGASPTTGPSEDQASGETPETAPGRADEGVS